MLRKRTAFKPNLKQVAAPQQQTTSQPDESTATATATAAATTTHPALAQSAAPVPQTPTPTPTPSAPASTTTVTTTTTTPISPIIATTPTPPSPTTTPTPTSQATTSPAPTVTATTITLEAEAAAANLTAITQLTGQKLEPIKSLSLRSLANKNVKLKDLLFFNPPMTKDQKRHKKSVYLAKKSEKKKIQLEEKTKADGQSNDAAMETASEEHSLVPKVKMGPEGKLILDESSTVINRKNSIKEQEAIVEDNEEIISRTNYDSFRRRPSNTSQTKWSLEDTKKFYQALTILGTDFSMMESLLFAGLRSRTELHKKFKREERVNKPKIDIALSNRIALNSEELDDLKEIFYK